jgi:hypothetical protein
MIDDSGDGQGHHFKLELINNPSSEGCQNKDETA